jgi:ankyrin repeat protein
VLGLGVETGGLNGYLALIASIGQECVTTMLLSHGANINFSPTSQKQTILHVACQQKALVCGYIEFLLKHGANVNAVDVSGTTPLMTSVSLDRLDLTSILLKYGATVDLIDNQGDSALSIAESLGLQSQIDFLQAAMGKSSPNCKRRRKNTYNV